MPQLNGRITLMEDAFAVSRDAGNPPVRFDVAGAGDGVMEPLNGHEAGNGGHSQGASCTPPRRSPTRLDTSNRGAPSAAGTITSPSCSPASRSSPPSAPGLFPPRPEKLPRGKRGTVPTVRTAARPERHFADSFITVRLAVARVLTRWLPRCPLCHRRPSAAPPGAHAHEHRRRSSHFNQ